MKSFRNASLMRRLSLSKTGLWDFRQSIGGAIFLRCATMHIAPGAVLGSMCILTHSRGSK
jgi:hypothetical protein